MIFEVMFTDEETISVAIDPDTFNHILKILVVDAYRMGKEETKETEEGEE